MYGFLCFWAFVGLVQGGFFDLTDVDDPFALLWNVQPIRDKLTTCTIHDNVSGICLDKAKCLIAGGTITQKKCGPFFTCCFFEDKCDKISDKKQGYFTSGNLKPTTTNCQYTIKLRNKNVCQVRLDFEELILAPTIKYHRSTLNDDILTCRNDYVVISPDTYGLPVVCGNSTKQHLYVHVNQTTDLISHVKIAITLTSRADTTDNNLPSPKWKIKFTQLECPLKRHKFDIFKYGDVENINNDFYALAPQGAVQYFTEPDGEFRSFALNDAPDEDTFIGYPYGLHYSIAFRRPSSTSCIKFFPSKADFLLTTTDPPSCVDYLYVPELYLEPSRTFLGANSDAIIPTFCTGKDPFYSLVPGPFYVNFKSKGTLPDSPSSSSPNDLGFAINYKVMSAGCPEIVS